MMLSRIALFGTALAIALGSYLYFLSQTDELLKRIQGDVEAVTGVVFSVDGNWIFSSGSRGLKRWNAETLKLDKEWKSLPAVFGELRIISRMTRSPNDPHLFLCAGRFVVVWDYAAEKELATFEGEGKAAITAIAVNKQGTVLACGEWGVEYDEYGNPYGAKDDYWIHLWDLKAKQSLFRFRSPTKSYPIGLDFSPDGSLLASRAGVGTIIWNATTGKEIARFGTSHEVGGIYGRATAQIAFTPDGKWVFNENELRSVDNWEFGPELHYTGTAPKRPVEKGGIVRSWPFRCLACDFTPDGKKILVSIGNRLALVDLETGRLEHEFVQFKRGNGVLSVAISPDGRMAVSGGDGIVAQGGFGYSSDESDRNLCFWRMPKDESPKK